MTAPTAHLPGLEPEGAWEVRGRSDPALLALADRHYSRGTVGASWAGPPGRILALVAHDHRAGWITCYSRFAMDGLDVYRCTMFRNEGPRLSSGLILEAVALTERLWGPPPADGWLTFVDASKVESSNPGYCFLKAGWRRDRGYNGSLIRLRLP